MNINLTLTFDDLPLLARIAFGALGIGMIVYGRKILWLFVGVIFALITYAILLGARPSGLDETTIVLIAVGVGAVLAAFTFFVRRAALVLTGLALGINLTTQFIRLLGPENTLRDELQLIISLVLGVLCVIAALRYRDDALIVLSVLAGVDLVTEAGLNLNMNTPPSAIFWLALCLFGVIVQYAGLQRERRAHGGLTRTALPPVGDVSPAP